MRILIHFPDPTDATSFYRGLGPLISLKKTNREIEIFSAETWTWNTLLSADIAFLQRPFTQKHQKMAYMIKEHELPLWVDYDDNLLCVPQSNPTHRIFSEAFERIKDILSIADVVTVSTLELARTFSKLNKNVVIVPNGLNEHFFKKLEKTKRNKIITWRGSKTHEEDLYNFKYELKELSEKHKDFAWVFMGDCPFFIKHYMKNVHHIPTMDIVEYHTQLKHFRPLAHIVPLVDNAFNKSKSNISWIEGTYAGASVVAPNWEEWDMVGCYNYSDRASFFTVLDSVLTYELNSIEDSICAIESEFLLSKINLKRLEILKNMIDLKT